MMLSDRAERFRTGLLFVDLFSGAVVSQQLSNTLRDMYMVVDDHDAQAHDHMPTTPMRAIP
jgi:hypothetical protein